MMANKPKRNGRASEKSDDKLHIRGHTTEADGVLKHVILHDLAQGRREQLLDELVAHGVDFTVDELGGYRSIVPLNLPNKGSLLARETVESEKKTERSDPATLYVKLKRRYKSFCNSLPPSPTPPRILSNESTSKIIEELYAARFSVEAARVRQQAAIQHDLDNPSEEEVTCVPFPEFVGIFIKQKYQMSGLANQACWDLAQSVEQGRSEDPTHELFARFLEESYDNSDMLFFLFAHSLVQKEHQRTISGPTDRVGTLTAQQCVRLARAILAGEQQQLLESLLTRLDGALVQNRSTAPEPFIHYHSFLGLTTAEYHAFRGGSGADNAWPESFEQAKPRFKSYLSLPTYEEVPPEAPRHITLGDHMDKEMQTQVEEMVRHLLASLEDSGHPNPIGPSLRQLFDWAVQIVAQRRRLEETFRSRWEAIDPNLVSTCLNDVLKVSVTRTVESAVTEMANNDVAHLEPDQEKALADEMTEQFLPLVETLLQSLLDRNEQLWMDQLPLLDDIDADPDNEEKHKQRFEHMSAIIMKLLLQDITQETIFKICRMVTNMDSLSAAVQHRANEKLYEIGSRQKPQAGPKKADNSAHLPTYSMEIAAKYCKMANTKEKDQGRKKTIVRGASRPFGAHQSNKTGFGGASSEFGRQSSWGKASKGVAAMLAFKNNKTEGDSSGGAAPLLGKQPTTGSAGFSGFQSVNFKVNVEAPPD
jgi:hypothetical protein